MPSPALLTPDAAAETRVFLRTLAADFPELQARSRMAPLFVSDGDLILLGADGAAYAFTHDDWENDEGPLAQTLDGLLERMTEQHRAGEEGVS